MKKHFIIWTILFSLFFSVSVYAHQGKTDGNGGHIDHSTGEYHYHHGYSAHQHEDLDGDGDRDCPYNFVDKTNHNSGGGGSSSNRTKVVTETKCVEVEVVDETAVALAWTFGFLSIVLVISHIVRSKSQRKLIEDYDEKIKNLYTRIDNIKSETKEYVRHYAFHAAEFPEFICMNAKGNFFIRNGSEEKKKYRITVFSVRESAVFHIKEGCSSAYTHRSIFDIVNQRPCKRCCSKEYIEEFYTPISQSMEKFNSVIKEFDRR